MSRVNKELINLMDGFRNHQFDFQKIIETAKEQKININYSNLRELSHSYPRLGLYLFPEIISDFIVSILKDFRPKKICEPRAISGSFLSGLVDKLNLSERSVGIVADPIEYEITQYLTKDENIKWELSHDDQEIFENAEINYDLIVCAPHFDPRNIERFEKKWWISEEDGERQDYEEYLLDTHNKYQECDGIVDETIFDFFRHKQHPRIGVFIVSAGFFNEQKDNDDELQELLDKKYILDKEFRSHFGTYIDLAVQLPIGMLSAPDSIPVYLIFVKNEVEKLKNHRMFVGQLSGDKKQDSILLKNYHERKPGRIPQQGVLIDESEFKGFDVLVNDYEIKQLVARSGLVSHSFKQLSRKITPLIKQRVSNNFTNSHNCIFVPLRDEYPIVLTEEDFSLAPSEYVQIVFASKRIASLGFFTNYEYVTEQLKGMDWNLLQRSEISLPFVLDADAVEVNFQQVDIYDVFSVENCVYLPIRGVSPVVTSVDEFVLKQGEYIQVILDPEKAFAPYVANFLNSQLGLKIRETMVVGLKIPVITKSSLEAGAVYLPDIETQREAIRVNSDIVNLSSELSILQRQLFDFPNDAKKIEGMLRKLSQEKGWEIWMEDLPFPMASILWAYLSTVDPKDKLEHISHFFEASIQFLATICLSALAQDRKYYRANQKEWNTENSKYKGWYKNASFGSWYSLHASLSKFIRRLITQEETKRHCLELFGNPDIQFIQAITSKKLLGVFEMANKYRNLWIGHRGRLSEKEAETRTLAFESLLSQMREIIGDGFSQIFLLSPKTNEYIDGLFEYKVKVLTGTRTEFKEVLVKTKVPMDKNKLYLLSDLQLSPVEILPFGKLMPSPKTEQNAFYFYSRFDNDGVRWVSYHFEKEAEVNMPDPEVVGLMKELFDGEDGT